MKKSLLAIPFAILASAASAQDSYDALRFSQTYQQGSARSTAMGGAFGALGGDISCLSNNPAGMSIYKNGEFSISPVFINMNSETTTNGSIKDASKFSFKMANAGFVQSSYNANATGIKGWAWGIAYNRLADFNGNEEIYCVNNSSSITDFWRDKAQGIEYNDLGYLALPGAYTYLIDCDSNDETSWYGAHDDGYYRQNGDRYGTTQRRRLKNKGGINSWDFSLSGNYNDKLYFGASLGLQSINYKSTNTYSEDDEVNIVAFEHFDYKQCIEDQGLGINLKAGIIYRPVNFLRFGAAIHTPTFYSITDSYYSTCDAVYDHDHAKEYLKNEAYQTYLSSKNEYDFKLYTPMKAIFSGAFIVPGIALLSADVELVNYSNCKFEDIDYNFSELERENDIIEERFKSTTNIRLGAEIKLSDICSFRLGYAAYGNPYNDTKELQFDKTFQRQIISGGFGFGQEDMYFDITGAYHILDTKQYLYKSNHTSQVYDLKNKYLNIMFTVGFRF